LSAADVAIIGAFTGALITGLVAAAVAYYQRTSSLRDEHLRRAFERHLGAYESIFVSCRSTLDALNDYAAINSKVLDRSDPFLHQLLDILRDYSYQYCVSVDWRHNPGMAYLDLQLEEKCLHLRDLLMRWLSGARLSHGDSFYARRNGSVSTVSAQEIHRLETCNYQELRIERRAIVTNIPGDTRLLSDIRDAASGVIKDLKAVMSH